MRVLFVTHAYPRRSGDAAGGFILELALSLRAVGVEVHVLAPAGEGLAPAETIDGVAVTRFRYAPRSWETLAYTGTMAEQVAASWRGKAALLGLIVGARRAIRNALPAFKPDVVHAHWWFPGGLVAWMSLRDTPFVLTLHGSDVRLATGSSLAPMLLRRVADRAGAVTAVSSWLASTARSLGATSEIRVASMPIDVGKFELNAADRERSVLFVGRLNAQKGVADLIDAVGRMPSDIAADIVGDGPDRAALHARARAAGLDSRVRWHGQLPRSAVASFYRKAALTVIPSRDEGLGLVAAEALLTGTPVVAYESGGVAELVQDGVTGILVPPGDVSALAGSMTALVGDQGRARAMGAAGRSRMLNRFAPSSVASTYADIYRSVVR